MLRGSQESEVAGRKTKTICSKTAKVGLQTAEEQLNAATIHDEGHDEGQIAVMTGGWLCGGGAEGPLTSDL